MSDMRSGETVAADPATPLSGITRVCALPSPSPCLLRRACDAEAASDGMTGTAHGAFGMCGEGAQNECPGWPGPPASMITGCLELMWNEGPGDDFATHGHYINMSNTGYTRVACGFAEANDGVWSVQNFQ